MSTGLGQIFPYRIREKNASGFPGTTTLNIDDISKLKNNVTTNNDVLPVATFETTATLPNGSPGNQFILAQFSHKLAPESILDNSAAASTNSGLKTSITVLEYDPFTEQTKIAVGRAFVGGKTYVSRGGQLVLTQVVEASETPDSLNILEPEGVGFPNNFSGADDLVSPKSFVFVSDFNNDGLSTFDTFAPAGLIRIIITSAVQDTDGKFLSHEVCTATTVGPDPNPPDVLGQVSGSTLRIDPGNSEQNVDPTLPIRVEFNKPVQPADMGTFLDPTNLVPGTGGVTISVTAAAATFSVIYYADPVDYGDLCNYIITPAYNLPGQSTVNFTVNSTNVRGLTGAFLGSTAATDFDTGDGPGVINAPVAPEVLYVGLGGPNPGLSVIDLNGFGQGTGDSSVPGVTERFSLNPNIGQTNVDPPLAPGTSNFDAGSGGVFTLTQDTLGETLLLSNPVVGQVGDIMIGNPLDLIFNNFNVNKNSNTSNQVNPLTSINQAGNQISVAPHPNPPKLTFPPPNPARSIFGEEPTRTSSAGPGPILVAPPCATTPPNLLNRGNPMANGVSFGMGIFDALMPGMFYGPQPPPPSPPPPLATCQFTSRQQIGHFLYVLDRDNRQILICNSNRMTVLDTIRLSDPIDMAMSPNLRTLAVANFSSSRISFIDINPLSSSFHTVIKETKVERGPSKIAWQPDGEALVVISPPANAATILSGLDFNAIKAISGFLNAPVDVVLTERYQVSGHLSGVYFGYILNANGTIAVYESGPDGVNGIGFNDIIGIVPNTNFRRPKKLLLDPGSAIGAVFVAHQDSDGLGQVSRLELTSSPTGPLPISQNTGGFIVPPTFRQKQWTVVQTFGGRNPTLPGGDVFSGNSITDIALDEILNAGSGTDQVTPFNNTVLPPVAGHSGKGQIKPPVPSGNPLAFSPYYPKFLFVACADAGMIDVMRLSDATLEASIPAPGVKVLGQYWRQ